MILTKKRVKAFFQGIDKVVSGYVGILLDLSMKKGRLSALYVLDDLPDVSQQTM
jgi:hypothetical protein